MKMLRTTVKAAAIVPVKTVFHVASISALSKNNFGLLIECSANTISGKANPNKTGTKQQENTKRFEKPFNLIFVTLLCFDDILKNCIFRRDSFSRLTSKIIIARTTQASCAAPPTLLDCSQTLNIPVVSV